MHYVRRELQLENWVWKVYTRWRKQRGVGGLLRLVKLTVRFMYLNRETGTAVKEVEAYFVVTKTFCCKSEPFKVALQTPTSCL